MAASSRVLTCFPFAYSLHLSGPGSLVVLLFLLGDVFGILQPTRNYDGKIFTTFEDPLKGTRTERKSLSDKNTQNLTLYLSACLRYCGKVS